MDKKQKKLFFISILGSLVTIISLIMLFPTASENRIIYLIVSIIIVVLEQFAVYQDIKDQMVYDIIHILTIPMIIIAFFATTDLSQFVILDFAGYALPFIYVLVACREQGLADTLFEITIILFGILLKMGEGPVIFMLATSYLLGLGTKLLGKINEVKGPFPYIPYLLYGFEIVLLYFFGMEYSTSIVLILSVIYAISVAL